jgi:hypothetical protein
MRQGENFLMATCLAYTSTLKVWAVFSTETFVYFYRTAGRHTVSFKLIFLILSRVLVTNNAGSGLDDWIY